MDKLDFKNDIAAMQIYEMLVDNDERLMGSLWEEMYCNEYDTFSSVLAKAMDIMKRKVIEMYDDELDDFVKVGDEKSRTRAMLRYMQEVIEEEMERL